MTALRTLVSKFRVSAAYNTPGINNNKYNQYGADFREVPLKNNPIKINCTFNNFSLSQKSRNIFKNILTAIVSISFIWLIYYLANYEKTIQNKRVSIPEKIRNEVWNRDGGKCVECGSVNNLEFDHIIPHSKGGADTYRNLQLLCQKCNRSKSNKIG